MQKIDLVAEVSELTGLNRVESSAAVEATMHAIKEAVSKGESVWLRGFGSFQAKKRKAKPARNISTGEKVDVQARTIPYFKPSKDFKLLTNKNN